MSGVRITYTSRRDATPEGERNALAAVYRFILDCHERKKAGCGTRPDDAEGESDGIRARANISQ